MARERLGLLKYSRDVTDSVCKLVELHLRFYGYGRGEWTDSAVRRYVRDAGDLLDRLHILVRSDCTTRNKRKAAAQSAAYDELEARIAVLAEAGGAVAIRPDLDGNAIMSLLGLAPGPVVGRAYNAMLELRLERGPVDAETAEAALLAWVVDQSDGGLLRPLLTGTPPGRRHPGVPQARHDQDPAATATSSTERPSTGASAAPPARPRPRTRR